MGKMTEQSIEAALAGEAQAHLKYLAFAEKAEKEGKANVARLFRCVAEAERIHAMDNLKVLSMINSTSENLAAARSGSVILSPSYDHTEYFLYFLIGEGLEAGRNIHVVHFFDAAKVHGYIRKGKPLHLRLQRRDLPPGLTVYCYTRQWEPDLARFGLRLEPAGAGLFRVE